MASSACVYLLRCTDDSLYCGWTTDVEGRLKAHNAGKASRYTSQRRPVQLVYTKQMADRSAAMREEARIKRLGRPEKLMLIRTSGRSPGSRASSAQRRSIPEKKKKAPIPATSAAAQKSSPPPSA
jgi:putative endonuclease